MFHRHYFKFSKQKKYAVDRMVKRGCLALGLIIIIVTAAVLIKTLFVRKESVTNKKISEYGFCPKADYQVNLLPNSYIKEETLGSGGKYIHNIVDTINITFSGDYFSDKEDAYQVNYQVFGRIEGYQQTNGTRDNIINQEFSLSNPVSQETAGSAYQYSENVQIRLQDYEDKVAGIKDELGLTLNYDLIVFIKGEITIPAKEGDTSKSIVIPIQSSISIPLNTLLFAIDQDPGKNVADVITKPVHHVKGIEIGKVTACILGLVSGFILLLVSLICMEEKNVLDERFIRSKQICKKYKAKLISLQIVPQLDVKEVYVISEIEDLIRLSDDIGRPAFYVKDGMGNIEEWSIFLFESGYKYVYYI